MKNKVYSGIFILAAIALMAFIWNSLKPSDTIDFSTQIKPILNNNCIICHGGVKQNAGLSFLFEEQALGDTESGRPAIIPGDAAGSELIRRIKEDDPELRMPYQKHKLSEEEIDLLTRWIDQGAKWGQHWAYSLPEKVAIPAITEQANFTSSGTSDFVQNGIDHFIYTRLQSEGVQPNPPAEKNTLARRLALDLTGLPPDQNLFEGYLGGQISYEIMVDTLLSKTTFGEKWASWWLDMARYSDSKGYEKDEGRSIYPYRDWVIKAFNQDLPYDRFTIEQLAGDLLPEPSVDQLIATAFHRNTMNNDEGGTDDEEYRVAAVIDRVNTTFEVWQSTTMGCVQCHSHPYDPFRHEDYYELMAFFNNSRDEDVPSEAPVLKFYAPDQQKQVDAITDWAAKYVNKETSVAYNNFLLFQQPIYNAHLLQDFKNGAYDDHASSVLWDDGACKLMDVSTQDASAMFINYRADLDGTIMTIRENNAEGEILTRFKVDKTKGNVTRKIPFKKIDRNIDLYLETTNDRVAKEVNLIYIYWLGFIEDLPGNNEPGYDQISKSLLNTLNTPTQTVPIMAENPDFMKRSSQVFERGNWLMKTDTVQAKTPEILNAWDDTWPKNRLGLSKWLVSKQNPLTARTLVNRVWHQLFGRGIVSTIEDIGSQSEPPSHPALLDWMSLRLMNEQQWSLKALIKEIVLSGTYRQSSEVRQEMLRKDPENSLYARGPRQRLSAEEIRDQALSVSGLLSYKMYGPGVMPPQPEGIWQTVYNSDKWIESKGEDRYRRAVYTYMKRTSPYPSFLTFDAGSREVCTIRRTVTNTPLQALVTLNDPVYLEAAYQLAAKMQVSDDAKTNITNCFERATYTKISPATLAILTALYQNSLAEFEKNKDASRPFMHLKKQPSAQLAALTVVANAIMNLDAFLTKA